MAEKKYKNVFTWVKAQRKKNKKPLDEDSKRHTCDICGASRQARYMVQEYASGDVDFHLAVSLGLEQPDPNQKYKWECGDCSERKKDK